MNLRDLRYALAVAEHRHFGRAAELCHISQPTLSTQLRKLEEELGVVLFERTNKSVAPTTAGEALLAHARAAVAAADAMLALAHASRDPLRGRLRLGIIPTLAPYLLPLVFGPLRDALPELVIEPWEDVTTALLDRLRSHDLDATLLATETEGADLEARPLFTEPFLAALPPDHPLTARTRVAEDELAADILVLADGHCLRDQALAACGQAGPRAGALRASSLSTLMNMVAAGYGTTLIPGLAAGTARDSGIALRPLQHKAGRHIQLVSRTTFPRRAAIDAIAALIRSRLAPFAEGAAGGDV
ncbi:LysR substrate-binding domain-containing protein [Falsiroseomonas selenitidurans]|uniref:LysR family transcriptional regulator n=1 Tax=Falsiroseomonas selenitidurans TaxID=2716335 RepID=A0ABX1E5M6_9PROT|nr:LysR substrate-binding domain-containing protein [Falsiroseomonas selenitidurans]NKC32298.1 LysR family transcriptional regulator [Falsiroseomonas selenitidurans]